MSKTNREKNLEHDARQAEKIRPKQPDYNWKELEAVIRSWEKRNHE
jgi:hypothetical protein